MFHYTASFLKAIMVNYGPLQSSTKEKKNLKGKITVPARDLTKSPAVRTDGKFCKALHGSPKNCKFGVNFSYFLIQLSLNEKMKKDKREIFGIVFFMPLWQMEENIKTISKSFALRCILLVFKLFFPKKAHFGLYIQETQIGFY